MDVHSQTWDYAEWDGVTIYRFVYWFEWLADTVFWPRNQPAQERFGIGPVAPERLPLTPEVCAQVHMLSSWHDTALDWDYPAGPGPWRQGECDRFNQASHKLYYAICQELGLAFDIVAGQRDEAEDPRLFKHNDR